MKKNCDPQQPIWKRGILPVLHCGMVPYHTNVGKKNIILLVWETAKVKYSWPHTFSIDRFLIKSKNKPCEQLFRSPNRRMSRPQLTVKAHALGGPHLWTRETSGCAMSRQDSRVKVMPWSQFLSLIKCWKVLLTVFPLSCSWKVAHGCPHNFCPPAKRTSCCTCHGARREETSKVQKVEPREKEWVQETSFGRHLVLLLSHHHGLLLWTNNKAPNENLGENKLPLLVRFP